jgi:hypothetical protein
VEVVKELGTSNVADEGTKHLEKEPFIRYSGQLGVPAYLPTLMLAELAVAKEECLAEALGSAPVPPELVPLWQDIVLMITVLVVGICVGLWMSSARCPTPTEPEHEPAAVPEEVREEEVVATTPTRVIPSSVVICPSGGQRFHLDPRCAGLKSARETRTITPCRTCCPRVNSFPVVPPLPSRQVDLGMLFTE